MTELFAESAYVGVAALDDAGRREQVARAHAIAVLAHRGQVDKLGVDSRARAVAVARERGLL